MTTPELSLDLRLRYLETIIVQPTSSDASSASSSSLARRVSQLWSSLERALESGHGTEAVRRFVSNYDLNEPLLKVPPVPFSSSTATINERLTPQGRVSLILEAEYEIHQLERELREIAVLDEQGVVGAGNLAGHESLKTELAQVKAEAKPVSARYTSLENKTTDLLTRYNDYISTLSELFVQWNDIISEAEEQVTRLEKSRNPSLDIS